MPQDASQPPAAEYTVIGVITIKPNEKVDFCVGVYEDILPQPQLYLQFRPDKVGTMCGSLVRIDGQGDYTLMYHFENGTTATYNVTICAGWPEED